MIEVMEWLVWAVLACAVLVTTVGCERVVYVPESAKPGPSLLVENRTGGDVECRCGNAPISQGLHVPANNWFAMDNMYCGSSK